MPARAFIIRTQDAALVEVNVKWVWRVTPSILAVLLRPQAGLVRVECKESGMKFDLRDGQLLCYWSDGDIGKGNV